MAMSFSTTKGVVSTALHVLADRGLLGIEDRVARFWPEFAQAGKGSITLRDVLSHRAGLPQVRPLVDRPERILDWEYMTEALAEAPPQLKPGGPCAYHAFTFGWLAGEILRRVDAASRSAKRCAACSPSRSGSTAATSALPPRPGSARATLIRPQVRRRGEPDLVPAADGRARPRLSQRRDPRLPAPDPGRAAAGRRGRAVLRAAHPRRPDPLGQRPLHRRARWRASTRCSPRGVRSTAYACSRAAPSRAPRRCRRASATACCCCRCTGGSATTARSPRADASATGFGHFGYGGSGAWCDPEQRLAWRW